MNRLYIGTSGWVYKGWANEFYPPDVKGLKQLPLYMTRFPTVEINATFYRLPTAKMVKRWHRLAPDGFLFAVKGSRYITHLKRLKIKTRSIAKFFNRIAPLKEHLGPILWQLPPNFKKDLPRLEAFLDKLPRKFCYAVEFRHPSWNDDEVVASLRRRKVALVSISSMRMPMNLAITADFIYLRFHGLESGFAHDYAKKELEPWARHCRSALRKKITVFGYFNNDANVRAPKNATELVRLTRRKRRLLADSRDRTYREK